MPNIALVEAPAHAELGPSSSHVWMNCTASVAHNRAHGVYTTNAAAEEGTLAHNVLEVVARAEFFPEEPHQPLPKGATEDMIQQAEKLVAVIKNTVKASPSAKVYIEKRVHMGGFTPDVWGTADVIIHDPVRNSLRVIDYKYGRIHVDPKENSQLLWYLLGAHATLGLKGFANWQSVSIFQPKNMAQPFSSWQPPAGYLRDAFVPKARNALDAIKLGNIEFSPEENRCRYCPGAATCPALKAEVDRVLSNEFKPLEGELLDEAKLAEALKLMPMIKGWMDATETMALSAMVAGKKIKGYKLVSKRTHRRWTDSDNVLTLLKRKKYKVSDITETKLLSPAKMEKLIKRADHKKELSALICKPEGEPTVAKTSDKRKEYQPEKPFSNLDK